jgi:hypothetical protein
MLPLSGCALRLLGYRRVQSIMIRLAAWSSAPDPTPVRDEWHGMHDAARMVNVAAQRSFPRARCLQKSLVLWWLLWRHGVLCDVWFGVRKDETGWEAHAWVELDGVVLNDRSDIRKNFAAWRSPLSLLGVQMRHV